MPNRILYVLPLLIVSLLTMPLAAQRGADPPNEEPSPQESKAVRGTLREVQEFFDQIWIPRSRYTNSPHLREAFRSVVAEARQATVEVREEGRRIALGGIVGPDGWIVTKASLVRGPVTCRLEDGRELEAELVGVDESHDLAMLKVSASSLPTLDLGAEIRQGDQFVRLQKQSEVAEPIDGSTAEIQSTEPASPTSSNEPTLQPGDWLATVGLGRDPRAIGVVSVLPRKLEKRPGFLGIRMDIRATNEESSSVLIEAVNADGAAKAAGMQAGDRILKVGGKRTTNAEELREAIMDRNPGDRLEIEIQRGEETLQLVAVLHGWAPSPAERRAYYQNTLGSHLSERRFGFPLALQHDTVLEPDECGGPIVNLDGRVVGFNISRAGRTESYALPVDEVQKRLVDLMSGRLAPAKVE